MKKNFVTYEIAKQLKELGFNEKCLSWYNILEGNKLETSKFYGSDDYLDAPLWQQAIDWLREEHKINICYNPFGGTFKNNYWSVSRFIANKERLIESFDAQDYYKARELAILKSIEIIKNN